MELNEFRQSITESAPPGGLSSAVQALWWDAKGDWDQAHRCAQAQDDAIGAWVHAYLHRKEGNATNAGHWYRRAGKPPSSLSLESEWEVVADALLSLG
jgi:hypothetical protein